MPGKEKPSAPMVQCCGAVKDKGGSYKRCSKTRMRHRLPEGLFTHGTMLEGTVCNSCYRFVMRCSQREKQNHAKCCNGPIPAHRERMEAFHLPPGMRFAVLDQPVPRRHVPASAIPPAMRRTYSDVGAAANARRLAVKMERSFSAGAAARATSHVDHHSHSCAGAASPSTPRRPRCYSVEDGTGQSPRMPKRARTSSFHDSVGAGGGACSSPLRHERVSAPSSEWASRVGSTASEVGSMEGDWSPSSSSSSAGAFTGLAQPSFRFTGAPAARQAAGARAAASTSATFDLDMDVGLDSDIDNDASLLRELFDDVLDSGLGDDEPGVPASSSQIAGSDSRSHNHPSHLPAAQLLNLPPPPAFVRRPVVTVAAAVGHFAAPAQVVVPPAGAAVADVVLSSFANSDPSEHVFITASDVPHGQGGFGISNIMAAADDNNAGTSCDSFDLVDGAAAAVVVGAGALASGMPASSDTTDDLNLGCQWLWDTSSGSC